MKTSIKKLLSSVQFNAMLLVVFTLLTGLLLLSSMGTHKRAHNIATQEQTVRAIAEKERRDLALERIQVNGILNQLPILIDTLENDVPYEFINTLFIKEASLRSKYVNILRVRYKQVSETASAYINTDSADAELPAKREKMLAAIEAYVFALYPLSRIQNEVLYQYFLLAGFAFGIILLWSFIVIATVRTASKTILADLNALSRQIRSTRVSDKYQTTEINTIALKLRQESSEALFGASKRDDVTQLPNYEGIKAAFDQRSAAVKKMQTFVCIFEIDNYAKLANHFPQSVIDPILVKTTSIMKLHKMQNDLFGRIQDGEFIAVLSRPEKEKALEDCRHICDMIEENRFKLPHDGFPITLSGGFVTKTVSQTLDDAVKNAKERLKIAQDQGGNTVSELKSNTKVL